MNEYDYYIEYYLSNYFKNMMADKIPRDYNLEEEIILASKIEYELNRLFSNDFSLIPRYIPGAIKKDNVYEVSVFDTHKILINAPSQKRGISVYSLPYNKHCCTMAQLFNIKGLYMKAYFLTLYINSNKIYCHDALRKLSIELEIDSMSLDILSRAIRITPQYERLYHYNEEGNFTRASIFVKYLDDKKIIIPISYGIPHGVPFCFLFKTLKPRLFNEYFLQLNPSAIVILTDSIELAGKNQMKINSKDSDIVWISFYGGKAEVPNIDWTKLKGRRVYYLLKEHSGLGSKAVYETANTIRVALNRAGVKEFKYASFLYSLQENDTPSIYSKSWPAIYTQAELEEAQKVEFSQFPVSFLGFKNDLSKLARESKPIMSPFIYERSTTLIYGDEYAGKTFFGLQIAYGISTGLKAFEGWQPPHGKAMTVLYLHGENGVFTLPDKLKIIEEGYAARGKNPVRDDLPQRIVEPCDVPVAFADTLYWNIADLNLLSTESFLENFIDSQLRSFSNHQNCLLILDGLTLAKHEFLAWLSNLIRKFKGYGWTFIIIAPKETNSKQRDLYLKRIAFDNVIQIRKDITYKDAGVLTMFVRIEKAFKSAPHLRDRTFTCKLNSGSPVSWVRTKKSHSKCSTPRDQLKEKVGFLHWEGKKASVIAEKLEISLSMVKKLKRELNLSKRRQPRLPTLYS